MPPRQTTFEDQARSVQRKLIDRVGTLMEELQKRGRRFQVGSASNTISPVDVYRVLDALYGWSVKTGSTDVTAAKLKPGISEAVARRGFNILGSELAGFCVSAEAGRAFGSPRVTRSICWPNLIAWVEQLENGELAVGNGESVEEFSTAECQLPTALFEQTPPAQADRVTRSAGAGHPLRLIGSPAQADTVQYGHYDTTDTNQHCEPGGMVNGFDEVIQEFKAGKSEEFHTKARRIEVGDGRVPRHVDSHGTGNDQQRGTTGENRTERHELGSVPRSEKSTAAPEHAPAGIPTSQAFDPSSLCVSNSSPKTNDQGQMTTRSVSPLESDPYLIAVLTIYGLDSPAGTIRAALAAGHTESTLRARVAWLRSQLVQVPFIERGAVTIDDHPSFKMPHNPRQVHACLRKPELVNVAPELGWGSKDGVWQSYFQEASQIVDPVEGVLSPKRWVWEDAERGRKAYAPNGGTWDAKPKTKRKQGESAVGNGQSVEPKPAAEVTAQSPLPIAQADDALQQHLSTAESRQQLAALVGQLPGGKRLRDQILSGTLSGSGRMVCREALKLQADGKLGG